MAKKQYRDHRKAVQDYDVFIISSQKIDNTDERNAKMLKAFDKALTREGFKWKPVTGCFNGILEPARAILLRKDSIDYLTKVQFLRTLAFGAFKQDAYFFASNGLTGSERTRTGYLVTNGEGTIDKGLFSTSPAKPNGDYTEIDGQYWRTER